MDQQMENTMDGKFIPMTSITSGIGQEVTTDIYCLPIQIVNTVFIGHSEHWVLIDAGMPESADRIIAHAEDRFGSNSRPKAIILTHGHFDHVGALVDLVNEWQVPVYAHELEMPYLTGKSDYPEPDGSVEGGLIAKMAPTFPNQGINLGENIHSLPDDRTVPEMTGWKWIHTPGHSPGHVSFFRDEDGTLIAGDAFITVRQDALFKVLTQKQEINGPPRYFTTDWQAAWDSVKKLEALKPEAAITGHGQPIFGKELREGLEKLVREFDKMAIPDYGKFV